MKVKLGNGQWGFRIDKESEDKIFLLRAVLEKYMEKRENIFLAFMDLENRYDRMDRNDVWRVVQLFGVQEKLMEAIKSY